jgi:predicted 2-oxoglutarate/Fe(II)-dependent dioxygenase YbiX
MNLFPHYIVFFPVSLISTTFYLRVRNHLQSELPNICDSPRFHRYKEQVKYTFYIRNILNTNKCTLILLMSVIVFW